MPRRYFNWRLAVVVVIAVGALLATGYALRQWQRTSGAEEARSRGMAAYEQGDWEEAAGQLGRYIAVHGSDVEALFKYAEAQLNIRPTGRRRVQQAVGTYRAILRAEPDNVEAVRRLAELYLAGAPGEAELVTSNFLETKDDPEVRRLYGMALAAQRKYEEAVAELKRVIEQAPGVIAAYDDLARLAEMGREETGQDAGSWYDLAVERNPDSALAQILRAGYAVRHRHPESARQDMAEAMKLDLSDVRVRLEATAVFLTLGDVEQAEAQLRAARQQEPDSLQLWLLWARLAQQSGAKEQMLVVAKEGLEALARQPWDFMPTAIELFIRGGDLEQARRELSRYEDKKVDDSWTAFLKGLLARAENAWPEAIRQWRRALETASPSLEVRLRLLLADAFEQSGDMVSAQRQLRDLVAKYPNHVQANLALARLQMRNRQWMEALDRSRKAMQLAPDRLDVALVHLQSAMQLQRLGVSAADARTLEQLQGEVDQLAQRTGNPLDVQLLQVSLAIRRGQLARAESVLKDLKARFADEPRVDLGLAQLAIARQADEEAVRILRQAMERYPDDVQVVRTLALYLDDRGDRTGCEQVLSEAVGRIEDPAAGRELGLLLAYQYTQWGQEDKAVALLEDLAKRWDQDILVRRQLLRLRGVLDDATKAQSLVDEIKAIEGEQGWQWRYEQARFWFATAAFRDHEADIVTLLQENLKVNPDDRDSRALLAAVYDRLGKVQSAVSLYRETLSAPGATVDLAVPAIAALYRAGEYEEGQRLLGRALRQRPDDPTLLRLQLQGAIQRGELDTAKQILQRTLENDPNDDAAALSLALLEMQQQNYDRAATLLKGLDAGRLNALLVSQAQVQLAIGQDRRGDALALCDELVAKNPTASAYLLRGRTRAALGQMTPAQADFEKAVELEPDNADVQIAMVDFYRSQGDREKALEVAAKARAAQPEDLRLAKLWLIMALESGGQEAARQAETLIAELLAKTPSDNELRLLQARLLLRKGTRPAMEEAAGILGQITSDEPTLAQAWVSLAQLQAQRGESGRAMDTAMRGLTYRPTSRALVLFKSQLEAARSPALAIPTMKDWLARNPMDTEAALRLADLYLGADEADEAVALLNRHLNRPMETSLGRRVRTALAFALDKSGRKEEARRLFEVLRQADPADPEPVAAQLRLLREAGDWQGLEAAATAWCREHPDQANIVIGVAGTLSEVGDAQGRAVADRLLQLVLKSPPTDPGALRVLGMLLQQRGRSDAAVACYERALKQRPDDVVCMNNLAWILADERGQLQEALQWADKGLRLNPEYADLLDTRGTIRSRLGQYAAAAEDFRRAIELYPAGASGLAGSHFRLGQVLAEMGRKTEAITHLERALLLASQGGVLGGDDTATARQILARLKEG